jgi:hypothetical protein
MLTHVQNTSGNLRVSPCVNNVNIRGGYIAVAIKLVKQVCTWHSVVQSNAEVLKNATEMGYDICAVVNC